MQRAYYQNTVSAFLFDNTEFILGKITKANRFELTLEQRNTWVYEILLLKQAMENLIGGTVMFEYTIPRVGNRIDNVLLYNGVIYLLEFKVGSSVYSRESINQVLDYALDLKNFHKESHHRDIVSILIATKAPPVVNKIHRAEDGVYEPILCNEENLGETLARLTSSISDNDLDPTAWYDSVYMPTPTIIEAAQALYQGHTVEEISRSDASAYNLTETTETINRIVEDCKQHNKKAICFITGVPGAGKTLAGLNIANKRHSFDENEHAVFLSGNQPLVSVLQEALARDDVARSGPVIRKAEAQRKAKAFIQIIHHFRDDAISTTKPPYNKIAIYDEAQRAWDEPALVNFMARKKGVQNFSMSEPEFLISIMDRHQDWSVIVCLIGGGQEINTGEAGILEWFRAIKKGYPNWSVYLSPKMTDIEYTRGESLKQEIYGLNYAFVDQMHLGVSLRSFRSEKLAAFVKELLDENMERAACLYKDIRPSYPLVLTRDLDTAKRWVKARARGTERYGLIASSGGIEIADLRYMGTV